jgi:hypothetical protein
LRVAAEHAEARDRLVELLENTRDVRRGLDPVGVDQVADCLGEAAGTDARPVAGGAGRGDPAGGANGPQAQVRLLEQVRDLLAADPALVVSAPRDHGEGITWVWVQRPGLRESFVWGDAPSASGPDPL